MLSSSRSAKAPSSKTGAPGKAASRSGSRFKQNPTFSEKFQAGNILNLRHFGQLPQQGKTNFTCHRLHCVRCVPLELLVCIVSPAAAHGKHRKQQRSARKPVTISQCLYRADCCLTALHDLALTPLCSPPAHAHTGDCGIERARARTSEHLLPQ